MLIVGSNEDTDTLLAFAINSRLKVNAILIGRGRVAESTWKNRLQHWVQSRRHFTE